MSELGQLLYFTYESIYVITDATMPSIIEEKAILHEAENSGDDADAEAARIIADLKEKDLLSRKRSQTEMEPAVSCT